MPEVIKKYWQPILLIIIAVGFIIFVHTWLSGNPTSPDVKRYIEKIDSLQYQIDSISVLKDSIDQRIDTVTIKIEKTRIQYEKDRITILSNTTDEDYMFFLNYIRSNQARLDSINNL